MISLLLEQGADPIITDHHGRTGIALLSFYHLTTSTYALLCSTALDVAKKARQGAAAVAALSI